MIPKYEKFMLPLLSFLSDSKEHVLREIQPAMAEYFNISEDEQNELLPSGTQTIFKNRVGWAATYLKKAGLISSSKRAHFKITDLGHSLLNEKPQEITSKSLEKYKNFTDFKTTKKKISDIKSSTDEFSISSTNPEEELELAHQNLHTELGSELLITIKSCSPDFFEQLVIDLLIAMGYGGSRKEAGTAMGKSGDGGIDGIINEDKLGLDTIYIQAKRWENSVPVKEIRDFTGALASKKARKGVFITTSSFPKSVYEFVSSIEYKIILLDGTRLANLMIEYGIGVTTVKTFRVKEIDSDYFEDI